MAKPVIDISLTSPFTLRDLDQFVRDARTNGFPIDEPVTVSYIHRGEYDRQIEDQWGHPMPVYYTGLSVTTEEDE